MPTITDSLFSLIIFIYVMITFLYLFYGFCWVEPPKLTEEQKKELAKQVSSLSAQSAQLESGTLTILSIREPDKHDCNCLNLGGPQSQANGSPGDDRRTGRDDGRLDGETVAQPCLRQKPLPWPRRAGGVKKVSPPVITTLAERFQMLCLELGELKVQEKENYLICHLYTCFKIKLK